MEIKAFGQKKVIIITIKRSVKIQDITLPGNNSIENKSNDIIPITDKNNDQSLPPPRGNIIDKSEKNT